MKRGEIYFVDLEPTMGQELRGRRPVLVVSTDRYNAQFAPLICPITSGGQFARTRGFAVPVTGGKTTGFVLCNQMRTLDIKYRGGKRVERADAAVMAQVLGKLQAIVAD
jgi:mRNA interferase ChpB